MSLQFVQGEAADLARRVQVLSAKTGKNPALHQKVEDALAQIAILQREARQPARVGLVGAFSAGKTRLLEALLGCAGALKDLVSENPSSGNILEFELVVGDVRETQLSGWKVQFMSEVADAGRLLRRLLMEARELQTREFAMQSKANELIKLLYDAEFEEGQRPRWLEVQTWAKKAHSLAITDQLKAIAFEVYRLAYTVGQAGEWLGKEIPIHESKVIGLCKLTQNYQEVYSQELSQWRTQPPRPDTKFSLDDTTPDQLRALFPIVKKLVVRATLSPTAAENFGGAAGLQLRLVDCPGAGADTTGFRDEVLCALELKDVDAIFAVLNARKPGENRKFLAELLRIWGPQAKERILAVVNRFDQLPHQDDSPGKRDGFAQGDSPLEAQEVMKSIPTLRLMYDAAVQSVLDRDPERVCFTSVKGYLTDRLLEEGTAARGTQEFYKAELGYPPRAVTSTDDPMGQRNQPWIIEMMRWGPLSERLTNGSELESQALGQLLGDFAIDGGFTRLQRILAKQLSRFGQAHKLERLMRDLPPIKEMVDELETEVSNLKEPAPGTSGPALPKLTLGQVIHKLANVYESYMRQATDDSKLYPLVRRASGSTAVLEILPGLRRWLIGEIHRWNEWQLLFKRIGRSAAGLVEFVEERTPNSQGQGEEKAEEEKTPFKSDDFLEPFITTLTSIGETLRERCQEALKYHSDQLLSDLTVRLGGKEKLLELRAAMGDDNRLSLDPFAPISESTDNRWLDYYLPDACKTPATVLWAKFSCYFPLQHGEEKPLTYAWYRPLFQRHSREFDNRQRHFMYVIKLRQVIVDAALSWLENIGFDVECALRKVLHDRLTKVNSALENEKKKTPLARPRIRVGD